MARHLDSLVLSSTNALSTGAVDAKNGRDPNTDSYSFTISRVRAQRARTRFAQAPFQSGVASCFVSARAGKCSMTLARMPVPTFVGQAVR